MQYCSSTSYKTFHTNAYPGEKDCFLWDIDQMKISISFTHQQKLSIQTNANSIYISFCKRRFKWITKDDLKEEFCRTLQLSNIIYIVCVKVDTGMCSN